MLTYYIEDTLIVNRTNTWHMSFVTATARLKALRSEELLCQNHFLPQTNTGRKEIRVFISSGVKSYNDGPLERVGQCCWPRLKT